MMFSKFVWILVIFCCNNPGCHAAELNDHSSSKLKDTQPSGSLPQTLSLSLNGGPYEVEKQANMLENSQLIITPSYLVSDRWNHTADHNGRQSRQNTPQTAALPLHPNNNVARPVGHGIKVEKQGRQTRQNTPAEPFHANNNVSRHVGHGINSNAITKPRNVLKTRHAQRTVNGNSYTPRQRIPRDHNRPRYNSANRNLTHQDHRRAGYTTNRNKSQDPRPARYNTNSRAYVKKSQNLRPARYDYTNSRTYVNKSQDPRPARYNTTNSRPYVNKSQNPRRLIKSEGPRRLNKSQDPRVPRQNPNRDLINIRSNSSNTSQDLRRISKRIPKREVIDIRSNSENKSPSGPPDSEAAHSNKEN
eukprot:580182_1